MALNKYVLGLMFVSTSFYTTYQYLNPEFQSYFKEVLNGKLPNFQTTNNQISEEPENYLSQPIQIEIKDETQTIAAEPVVVNTTDDVVIKMDLVDRKKFSEKDLEDLVEKYKNLEKMVETMDSYVAILKSIDFVLFAKNNAIDKLQNYDKIWLELSIVKSKFNIIYEEYKSSYNKISANIEDVVCQNAKLLDLFNTNKPDMNVLMDSTKYPNINNFIISLDQIKTQLDSSYSQLFKMKIDNHDMDVILKFLVEKFQLFTLSNYHKEVIDLVENWKTEVGKQVGKAIESRDILISKMSKEYESKMNESNNIKAEAIQEEVNQKISQIVNLMYTSFNTQLLSSLDKQRQDIETTYEIKNQTKEAELTSQMMNYIEPLFARLLVISDIIKQNNQTIENSQENASLLRLAYLVKLAIQANTSDMIQPLDPYISKFQTNDEHLNKIVSKFPPAALTRGIYTEGYLLNQLPTLIKKSEKYALIHNKPITRVNYAISYIHALLHRKMSLFSLDDDKAVINDIYQNYHILDNLYKDIEDKDLIQCLDRIKQLKGNTKKSFEAWIQNATDTIETTQISDILLIVLNNRLVKIEE